MRRHLPALAVLLPLFAMPVPAAAGDAPAPSAGKVLFDRWCAQCHAPGHGHPGTQQLGRMRGAKLAVLEQRGDLSAGLIRLVVRNGQSAMPPYRPSEISDAELEQIAAHLVPPSLQRPRR